jgi:hypothetical protein
MKETETSSNRKTLLVASIAVTLAGAAILWISGIGEEPGAFARSNPIETPKIAAGDAQNSETAGAKAESPEKRSLVGNTKPSGAPRESIAKVGHKITTVSMEPMKPDAHGIIHHAPTETPPRGDFTQGRVKLDEEGAVVHEMTPDSDGKFPLVPVKANEKVHVVLNWPSGTPGELVTIHALDGGTLPDNAGAIGLKVGDDHTVKYDVTLGQYPGEYSFLALRGTERRYVRMWVGDMNTVTQRDPVAIK